MTEAFLSDWDDDFGLAKMVYNAYHGGPMFLAREMLGVFTDPEELSNALDDEINPREQHSRFDDLTEADRQATAREQARQEAERQAEEARRAEEAKRPEPRYSVS